MAMSDLFQDYSEAAGRTGAYDEMFAPGQMARDVLRAGRGRAPEAFPRRRQRPRGLDGAHVPGPRRDL